MSNEVEIHVTGKDSSGPAFAAAEAKVKKISAEAEKLDKNIASTRDTMRTLAEQIANTSDEAERADLSKKFSDQQRSLTALKKVRAGLDDVGDGADTAGSKVRDAGERARVGLDDLGDGAERSSRRVRGVGRDVDDVGIRLRTTGRGASSLGSTLGEVGGQFAGFGLLAAKAAAIGVTGFLTLAPAVMAVGGAAGAATAGLLGLISAAAVLGLGLGGLADAWQAANTQTAGGASSGKAAAAAQKEVKAATTALADAQKAALVAQKAVNDARKQEAERLEDLSRSLAGARLDEQGAILGVERAEQRLKDVRANKDSTALDIREAELAYRQAIQSVDDMKDRVADLAEEQEDGARKGVEGSDAVQQALERQLQAQRQVEESTARLAEAQKDQAEAMTAGAGGVDKFAEAMSKLSKNGRALITTLLELKPRFDQLKDSVQDRLLAGFDVVVKDLAGRWLPALGPMLGGLADRFNAVGKTIATALGRTDFIDNVSKSTEGFGVVVSRIGDSMAPLIDAFGRLGAASVPYLTKIGDLVAGLIDKFSNWIKTADESGALSSFMKDAAASLQNIWNLGGQVFGLLGDITRLLFPASKSASDSVFAAAERAIKAVRDVLNDEKFQAGVAVIQDKLIPVLKSFGNYVEEKLVPIAKELHEKHLARMTEAFQNLQKTFHDNKDEINQVVDVLEKVGKFILEKVIPIVVDLYSKYLVYLIDVIRFVIGWIAMWVDAWNWLWRTIDNIGTWISDKWTGLINFFSNAGPLIRGAAVGMWDGIKDSFRTALNWIIDRWNGLDFTIGGGSIAGISIPSTHLGVPQIQRFAHGGIGGGLAMVGERGIELVELPQGSRVIPNGTSEQILAANSGAGTVINLTVNAGLGTDGAAVGKQIIAYIKQFEFDNGTRWREATS